MPDRARRLYKLLLRCYPAEFRRYYFAPMLQLFDDLRNPELPDYAPPSLPRIFSETFIGAIKEQAAALYQKLTGEKTMPARKPLSSRQRLIKLSAISAATIAVLAITSWVTGFWNYDGPFQAAIQIYQTGQRVVKVSKAANAGFDDVTANFVADYVQATYYHSGRTDVGYQSVHADASFKQNVENLYQSVKPGFDQLTCSTQAPTGVKYTRTAHPLSSVGYAAMYADFSYAGSDTTNRVQYELVLDQSRTVTGTWRLLGATCLTLDAQAGHPYVLKDEPDANSRAYDTRNDRTFGAAN